MKCGYFSGALRLKNRADSAIGSAYTIAAGWVFGYRRRFRGVGFLSPSKVKPKDGRERPGSVSPLRVARVRRHAGLPSSLHGGKECCPVTIDGGRFRGQHEGSCPDYILLDKCATLSTAAMGLYMILHEPRSLKSIEFIGIGVEVGFAVAI